MHCRSLVRPGVVGPVVVWALLLGLIPAPAAGAPLPLASSASAGSDPRALEARLVASHLATLGVSPEEAAARVDALSEAERHALATRLDELGAGGSTAAVLGVAFLVAALVILVLELMGRRIVSRP